MNPILPLQHFIPDVEARQWADGRLYLYGSCDIAGNTTYCSHEYRVFSTADLRTWQDHGVSFRSADAHAGRESWLYAPDCICLDGRYHLCYCCADGSEGIAVSSHPAGPFSEAWGVAGADGDAIDPAIFLDDDGSAYYFWGQFHLRGAKLRPDLRGIDPATLDTAIITEAAHGFHEGASVRKRGGLYYLVYTDISRGRATSLGYAVSRSPLGPYEKRGIIIDNTGCDPETWNNHGSIAEFNGAWYVFYHRSSMASRFNRRVCIEPIQFDAQGDIAEVEMTTQGADPPIPATQPLAACRACLLHGHVRTGAQWADTPDAPWQECLTEIHNGDHATYRHLDFSIGVTSCRIRAASMAYGGTIEMRLDQPDGPLLGTCQIPHTGGWRCWTEITAPIAPPPTGVHAVHLVFCGGWGRLFDLAEFTFA
jgi:hypothetical protein